MPPIVEQIEQAILLGEYAVGTRLDETQLAAVYNVSRTPVREALKQLVASGLVEHKPNRGVFVRALSIQELLEMFDVMAELEAYCSTLAARRVNHDDIKLIRELANGCEQALESGDSDCYYHANELLHLELYRCSGNQFLAKQAGELHKRLQPYRRLQLRVPYRMRQSMAEHREIVQAICSGDAKKAASATRTHVVIQGEKFHDLLADLKHSVAV